MKDERKNEERVDEAKKSKGGKSMLDLFNELETEIPNNIDADAKDSEAWEKYLRRQK